MSAATHRVRPIPQCSARRSPTPIGVHLNIETMEWWDGLPKPVRTKQGSARVKEIIDKMGENEPPKTGPPVSGPPADAVKRWAPRQPEWLVSAKQALRHVCETNDEFTTGAEIVEAHALGELDYAYMGRNLGLNGNDLAKDLDTGTWRFRTYEVRHEPLPGNRNWFAISGFIKKTVV